MKQPAMRPSAAAATRAIRLEKYVPSLPKCSVEFDSLMVHQGKNSAVVAAWLCIWHDLISDIDSVMLHLSQHDQLRTPYSSLYFKADWDHDDCELD